jgi:hypothetical protein
MGNLEHLIKNIDEKIYNLHFINDYLFNTIIPIINKQLYENILEKLTNDYNNSNNGSGDINITNFDEVINNINCNINIIDFNKYNNDSNEYYIYLKYLYINKNLFILLQKFNEFKKIIENYENNIIFYITNYYYLKNIHIKINNNTTYTTTSSNELNTKIENLLKELDIHSFTVKDIISNNDNNHNINFNKLYKHIFNQYNNFISTYDIYGKLDNYQSYLSIFINNYIYDEFEDIVEKQVINNIKQLLNNYKKTIIDYDINKVNYDVCICGTKMIVRSNTSELICIDCGNTVTLLGTIFEDSQFYNQEGNRYKHGSYIPSRHCKYWIDRIQAKENTTISQDNILKIENCILRDGIKNKKIISIEQFRKYLKETKLSVFNDHIPLIRKYITGITPPQLTPAELSLLFNYFDKSVKTYNNIKPKTKMNCIYYPYILYKILEIVIKDKKRRRDILCCIHLQGNKTLIDNDKNWKLICAQYKDDFPYKPTDRNDIL